MKSARIVVIGGGAAGFFGAIRTKTLLPDAEVIILEKGKKFLQKVKISGGGRCNVTNAVSAPAALSKNYPRGQQFLKKAFKDFSSNDTRKWFGERGVETKIEADQRVFPISDNSQSIIDCLVQQTQQLGIEIRTQQRVDKIVPPTEEHTHYQLKINKDEHLEADALLLCPGSSPKIWQQLEHLGHTVIPPVPSLFTFNIKDARIKDLAGISVAHAEVQVVGHKKLKATGPVLITHWGLSGPGILKVSAWGARQLKEEDYNFKIRVNWRAGVRVDEARKDLLEIKQQSPKRNIYKHSYYDISLRFWQRLVEKAGIPQDLSWASITKQQLSALAHELTQGEYTVNGKSTFKDEFVTAGGVDLAEVSVRNFQSKLFRGLYFAGEVLNIDAITGGFNFQAAWTGSWIAAEAIARHLSLSD